jgi:ATP-dependent DNA helicase RecQ
VSLDRLLDAADGRGGQLLVSSELEELVATVEADLFLRGRLTHPGDAVRGAVTWMHDLRIITVQNGLAVFRSAMKLDRDPAWPALGSDEAREARAALEDHQAQKILRVHVMDRWARTMIDDPVRAEALRSDWFTLTIEAFKAKWFDRQKAQIERPTTPESYRDIVTALNDADQQAIVTRDVRRNHLVLAGPGSGKTRVLVHRVAWLLRCQRIRARQILVVCYTRANALELRRRLTELVGLDARHVHIHTLHSVAMRMVGAHRLKPEGDLDIDACIGVAAAMLRGDHVDSDQQPRQRDALLRGFNYLLIDEYQDIDADKYELLSAITGRAMGADQRKIRVFAVGDDDQAIFSFDGASTSFIRSFETDYGAERFVVPRNYRNPRAVLDLAQAFIRPLPDRLKAGQTLVVDPARESDPPGGPWAAAHDDLRGRMVWHEALSVRAAAHLAMVTARRWIDDGIDPASIGILTRTRREGLHRLRIAAEAERVPFSWPLPSHNSVPIGRIREVVQIHELLSRSDDWVKGTDLAEAIDAMGTGPWATALRAWLEPNEGRRRLRDHWRYDLTGWARLERRARTIGDGVHLGTMHGAKGLEFDHVMLLDDGTQADNDEERRLMYVALTRARRSLQLFSSDQPSPVFRALDALGHPTLERRPAPLLAADAPSDRDYGLLGHGDIWLDWLGRQPPDHPGHRALDQARYGDAFHLALRSGRGALIDEAGREVALLSKAGTATWMPRVDRGLKLRLVATTREWADKAGREPEYRERLRVDEWWTGVWEGRWSG